MPSPRFFSFLWLSVSLGLLALRQANLSIINSSNNRQTSSTVTPIYHSNSGRLSSSYTSRGDEFTIHERFVLSSDTDYYATNHTTKATDPHLCERSDLIDGQWVKDEQPNKPPPYVTSTVHLRCFPKAAYYDGTWESWIWRPSNNECEFDPDFRKQDFCDLLPKATVSIIGDSLSWEQFSSLVQLSGVPIGQKLQHQSKELNTNIVVSVCDGQTKLIYRRDDHLDHVTASIQQHFPTVLILNRGAHYFHDDVLLPAIRNNIEEVRNWLQECDARGVKCHFFWRTSVPGHPGCGNFTAPVNDLSVMEQMVADESNYNHHTLKYHWYDYQHQNLLVQQELEGAKLSSLEFIDAYYLNIRRPDQHRSHQDDCLHNCYPGKMDVYNQLLLHYLKQQRNANDIAQHVQKSLMMSDAWIDNENTVYDEQATEAARQKRLADISPHQQRNDTDATSVTTDRRANETTA